MKIFTLIEKGEQYQNLLSFIQSNFTDWDFTIAKDVSDVLNYSSNEQRCIFMIDDSVKDIDIKDILDKLFKSELYNNIYIILLTNSNSLEKVKFYMENGADYCLKLPINEANMFVQLKVAENTLQHKIDNAKIEEAYSNLKEMQIRLIQSEKLAGVGRLAAGIAHEINNPLGFVSGNTEVLEKYISRYENILDYVKDCKDFSDEECIEACKEISKLWKNKKIDKIRKDMGSLFSDTKEGLNRISVIVTGLKNFSRVSHQDEKGYFDLNDGIQTTLIVAKNELKYNCNVDFIPGDIPNIYGNGGQLNQVILNILINSAYAIREKYNKEKGNVTIKTFKENNYICCSIKDDGCGMDNETLHHIFEPFFTTKPVGVGTGLGMGIAYDIVFVKHNGTIDVKSELGKGTEFIIKLPEKSNGINGTEED